MSDAGEKPAVLARIRPSVDLVELRTCELLIEAVFENPAVKAQVIRAAKPHLKPGCVFGTNTSSIPITRLVEAAEHPAHFIGIHFFSPVDKMPRVEIICGRDTADETLAKAFDFARQLHKIPIVVNDHLGFFTTRVFSIYLDEGARLLIEGVDPVLIENLACQWGTPAGTLALQDEVNRKLGKAIVDTDTALGVLYSNADTRGSTELIEKLSGGFDRGGRLHGGGFYEYPADGREKYIWPKLCERYAGNSTTVPYQDIQDRLLFRQVLNTCGLDRFSTRTYALAAKYGERFNPPALLLR